MSIKDGLKRTGAAGLAVLAAAVGGVAKMPQVEEMRGIESLPAIHQTLWDCGFSRNELTLMATEKWIEAIAEAITVTRKRRESNSIATFNRNSGMAAGSTGGSEGEDDE